MNRMVSTTTMTQPSDGTPNVTASANASEGLNIVSSFPKPSDRGYPTAADLLEESSAEFRATLIGLGRRVPLSGRADMLAGKRQSPHGYAVLLLNAMRQAGLPREAAERWLAWNAGVVARLWAADQTPPAVLEDREQALEDACDEAHLKALRTRSPEDRRRLRDARMREVAAEMAVLANPEAL